MAGAVTSTRVLTGFNLRAALKECRHARLPMFGQTLAALALIGGEARSMPPQRSFSSPYLRSVAQKSVNLQS